MVVDDNKDALRMLKAALDHDGHSVYGAQSGVEALQVLVHLPDDALPEVILLDYEMPWMNGVEFREAQLADPRLKHIRVVVFSGADPEELLLAFKGLDVTFLQKPATLAAIRQHLQ